ncbi:hypothetical protein M9978_06120 [Sphingomonas sp. MG17]|uniref:Phospholipase/carboxylesterase n=1 Tax=Sphingomonas tagetis TaxID=2949092 RepID=A0A9X2KL32_9SPHN|nr:hypothetical protein [Sphingomonas tagetis]MCP3730001.1 hypothetical protein [Sphingomonas tagetis]
MPERRALLLTPERGRVRALAVELHGSGMDAARQRAISGLADLLLANDIAVLLPQAAIPFQLMPDLQAGFAWHIPGAPLPDASDLAVPASDDFGWIDERVAAARSDLGLTDAPLFLAGYSGGARLASHLLVKSRLPWTAAGLVAGLRAVAGDRAPPPTIAFHGLDDPINPYGGSGYMRWDIGMDETCARYAAAQGSGLLDFHALPNAAHAWPGSSDREHLRLFGPDGEDFDASALIAAFFMRHMARNGRDE